MRWAFICTTALIIGFVSGGFVAIPFFATYVRTVVSTVQPIPVPESPTSTTPTTPQTPIATSSPTTEIQFATPILFAIDETVTYPDGLMVTVTAINDSRCKPDVQCIWAGELSPQLSLTGGDFKDTISQQSLGTSRAQKQTIGIYTVTLETATLNDATIVITKEAIVSETNKPTATVAGTQVTKRPAAKPLPTVPPTPVISDAAFGAEVASLITAATKKIRQDESLTPFSPDRTLAASAKKYSSRLLAGNYLAHIDKNGCDLTCRFTESGYQASSWGENLAMMEYDERPSAEYVANFFMTQWQKSAGHRKNLLSDTFTHQGVGVSVASGKIYVAVHFALPE